MQMRTARLSSLPLFFVLMLRFEVAAQDLPDVVFADLIRVAVLLDPRHKRTIICESVFSDAIYLTLEKSGKHGKVPLASITSLEVCRGTKRKTWTGAGIGATVGMVGGGIAGSAIGGASDPQYAGVYALVGVIIGAPSGFLLGAVIGSQIKSEQWEEVPLGAITRAKNDVRN